MTIIVRAFKVEYPINTNGEHQLAGKWMKCQVH